MYGNGWMMRRVVLATALIGFGFWPAPVQGGGEPDERERVRPGGVRRAPGIRRPLGGPRGGRGPGPEMRREGRGGRMEPGEPGAVEITEEEIEAFLEMVSEAFPKRYEKMIGIREKRPEAFRMMMQHRGPMLRRLFEAKRRSPELAVLVLREQLMEEQLGELERRHRDASKQEKMEIEKEVRSVLGGLFDVKMARQANEIGHLEERLARHKRVLEERKGNKEEILKREFDRRMRPELSFE